MLNAKIIESDKTQNIKVAKNDAKNNDLASMAMKIRTVLVNESAKGGMHFSSGMGVVELTLALFEVFDFDKDNLVFDVGHQRFPYMILKEYQRSGKIKMPEGNEEYNMFMYPGFAGLSVASTQGFALTYPQQKAIAMVGDGSLTCGEVFESLNNIGQQQNNALVILNQNGQSITDNVGALADGTTVKQYAEGLKFEYIGPIDGHDVNKLIQVLNKIKHKKHPVFLHVNTIKGKGYNEAVKSPMKFHRPTVPYDKKTGDFLGDPLVSQKVMGAAMGILEQQGFSYIEKYKDVFFTAPACPVFSQITQKYPEKVIDTGISEQHCMTLSTTLAELGNKVIMTLIGPFLYRCYSQVLDLCHQNAPLTVVYMMSGINPLGATHQAVGALSVLKLIPNMTIMHPVNLAEYQQMLDYAVALNKPVFLHIPKENPELEQTSNVNISMGKAHKLTSGDKLTILPVGSMFEVALDLAKRYDGVEIINPRFLKPFDSDLLVHSVSKTKKLLILEDAMKQGGLGQEVIYDLRTRNMDFEFQHVAAEDIYPSQEDYATAALEYGVTMDTCQKAFDKLYNR